MSDTMEPLEPAIPPHLRVERTLPLNAPKSFTPAHPSFSARFDPSVKTLPMLYLGLQFLTEDDDVRSALANLKSPLSAADGPAFWDEASFVDERGYTNVVLVGYWDNHDVYQRWESARPEGWWHATLDIGGSVGAFREAYIPSVMDTETTFSHPYPEGYSRLAPKMSGATDTHEYWGSARDRIPRSQTDTLAPEGVPRTSSPDGQDTRGRLIVVTPHTNLCLLRSGQDWSETSGDERQFYLGSVEPMLRKGMIEITTESPRLGCYFNRYMVHRDAGGPIEKSYSVSAWHSLADLEKWVKTDTHLAIWGAGIKHYKLAGAEARLRLYHEMMVLEARSQEFAYFNCHDTTGMLGAARQE